MNQFPVKPGNDQFWPLLHLKRASINKNNDRTELNVASREDYLLTPHHYKINWLITANQNQWKPGKSLPSIQRFMKEKDSVEFQIWSSGFKKKNKLKKKQTLQKKNYTRTHKKVKIEWEFRVLKHLPHRSIGGYL